MNFTQQELIDGALGHLISSQLKAEDAPCSADIHLAQAIALLASGCSDNFLNRIPGEGREVLRDAIARLAIHLPTIPGVK